MPHTRRVGFVQALLLAVCFAACGSSKMATEADLLSEWGQPCSTDPGAGMEVWHYCAAPCPAGADHAWCHGACSEGCFPTWTVTLSGGLIIHTDGPEGGR